MKLKDKETFKLRDVVIIIIITSLLVSLSTGLVVVKRFNKNTEIKINKNEYINDFISAYTTLVDSYYEKIDEKELMDIIITSLYDYVGDPYTTYLNEQETALLMESLNGKYQGIGVRVIDTENNKGISIIEVFDNSPAAKAGIEVDDLIIKVNNNDVKTKTALEVNDIIKSNNSVAITVLRGNKEKNFNLELSSVDIPSVTSEIYKKNNHKIGYIYIEAFAINTYEQFKVKLEEMEKDHIDSLIIDVRTNTGGYLTTAKEISELFLEKGKIIYSLKNKSVEEVHKDETEVKRSYPIVILTNEVSASASEILTAALKESYGALSVGKTTYGKGKIQQTTALKEGGMLKYTTASWFTPKGTNIDTVGIKPDYEVEYKKNDDLQLNKALEILSK